MRIPVVFTPVLTIVLAGAALGCVSLLANEDLPRISAQAITPTPYPDSVTISDIKHGTKLATWVATTRHGVYDCSIESKEQSPRNYPPLCAKREPVP
jgi:hypothetical protein